MARTETVQKRWSTDQLITGIETADWLKLLGRNGWNVDGTYLHRAAWVGAMSLPLSVVGRMEDARFGRQLAAMKIDPEPLFLLGHWRSGTTHLHNLFGRAPGNTYPTVYQAVFPTTFLSTESFVPKIAGNLLGETRTYDNVKQGWGEAAEDEIALAKMTGMSPYIAFMFPENAPQYEKYVDFLTATTAEKETWKDAFQYLIKKIMLQTGGKRVVVKSCTHTARIRLLLEMFPNAKFVHIHRHPYRVFASTLHMRSHTDWENFFQVPEEGWDDERVRQTLMLGKRIFDRVTEDRHLIPAGNLVEIAYDDLVKDELGTMRMLYERLGLPGWTEAEKAISAYVRGIGDYQVNKLKLTPKNKNLVWEQWRSSFDAYGYPKEYDG
jgi:hypothetical protein